MDNSMIGMDPVAMTIINQAYTCIHRTVVVTTMSRSPQAGMTTIKTESIGTQQINPYSAFHNYSCLCGQCTS